MAFLTPAERNALTLSTLAGLSTSLGAAAALVRRPGPPALAFLLGLAAGVMGLLAVWELWWVNAGEHGFAGVTAAVVGGAGAYVLAAPRLPALEDGGAALFGRLFGVRLLEKGGGSGGAGPPTRRSRGGAGAPSPSKRCAPHSASASASPPPTPAELLRLGLLTAAVMSLHNLPEGVAVVAAANTAAGPRVFAAIVAHNLPEGVIISAPVFAATGSRWAALALATASGLSEPVGAAGALLVARAWEALGGGGGGGGNAVGGPGLLPFLLAAAGGVMGAVCVVDLIPEAQRCGAPSRLAAGVVVGGALMAATLVAGV